MFNETSYFGDRTAECQALKDNCDSRFPVDPNNPLPANDPNWDCMKSTGYVKNCMDNKSYAEPGATIYPLDILTNTDNPDYVLPDLGLGALNTPAVLLAGAALVGLILLRR